MPRERTKENGDGDGVLDKYKDKHNQRAERENNKQKCGATFGFFLLLEPRRKLCIELKNKKKKPQKKRNTTEKNVGRHKNL